MKIVQDPVEKWRRVVEWGKKGLGYAWEVSMRIIRTATKMVWSNLNSKTKRKEKKGHEKRKILEHYGKGQTIEWTQNMKQQ